MNDLAQIRALEPVISIQGSKPAKRVHIAKRHRSRLVIYTVLSLDKAMILLLLALSKVPSSLADAPITDTRKIILADRAIDAVIDRPQGEGPHPLLIIAPGRSFKMKEANYPALAEAARKAGFVVIRFNWGFRKSNGPSDGEMPTADLKQEAEDLSTVLSSFTQGRVNEPLEINHEQVALVADGFSARISMLPESGALKPAVKSLILLNPECDAANSFTKLYAPMASLKSPRLLITTRAGNTCEPAQVYDLAKASGTAFSLYLISGEGNPSTITAAVVNALVNLDWKNTPHLKENDAKKTKKTPPNSHIGHPH